MTYNTRQNVWIRNGILLASAAAWTVLLAGPESVRMFAHCAMGTGAMPLSTSLRMLWAMNDPVSLAAGWMLMVVAMMAPVVFQPLCHIRSQSFAHRHGRSIALFLTSYLAIWMLVGSLLFAIALARPLFAVQSYLPAAGALFIALIWQCSPIKQRCLNRCHAHTELAAFGPAADLDALCFGAAHGAWCSGSCWTLMLFPILLPKGHIVAMAIVTILIFSERLERPRMPGWRWRGFGKVIRIVVAQARMRLHFIALTKAGCYGSIRA